LPGKQRSLALFDDIIQKAEAQEVSSKDLDAATVLLAFGVMQIIIILHCGFTIYDIFALWLQNTTNYIVIT